VAGLGRKHLEEVGRPVGRGLDQAPVPAPQRIRHLSTPADQLPDLVVYGRQQLLRGLTHAVARPGAPVTDAQKRGDVAERKTEMLRVSDQRQSMNGARWIMSVPGWCSGRFRQQAELFVVPDRAGRDASIRRKLPDRHRCAHRP